MAKRFPLRLIFNTVTGELLPPTKFEEIHELLNYMTGCDLMVHDLVRARRECIKELLLQYPELARLKKNDFQNIEEMLRAFTTRLLDDKQCLPIDPMPEGRFLIADPVVEIANLLER